MAVVSIQKGISSSLRTIILFLNWEVKDYWVFSDSIKLCTKCLQENILVHLFCCTIFPTEN